MDITVIKLQLQIHSIYKFKQSMHWNIHAEYWFSQICLIIIYNSYLGNVKQTVSNPIALTVKNTFDKFNFKSIELIARNSFLVSSSSE